MNELVQNAGILNCKCGSIPKLIDEGIYFYVKCISCGSSCGDIEADIAIENWNKLNMSNIEILIKEMEHLFDTRNGFDNSKNDYFGPKACKKHGFVYIANTRGTNQYKIGVTTSLSSRLSQFKTANPMVSIIASKETNDRYSYEKMLHKLYFKNKLSGEWFTLSNDQIVELIKVFGFNYFIEGIPE